MFAIFITNLAANVFLQVQQAAASGKPMPPGAKLQTTDGIVGIVLPNNNVQLQIPPNFHQRLLVQCK